MRTPTRSPATAIYPPHRRNGTEHPRTTFEPHNVGGSPSSGSGWRRLSCWVTHGRGWACLWTGGWTRVSRLARPSSWIGASATTHPRFAATMVSRAVCIAAPLLCVLSLLLPPGGSAMAPSRNRRSYEHLFPVFRDLDQLHSQPSARPRKATTDGSLVGAPQYTHMHTHAHVYAHTHTHTHTHERDGEKGEDGRSHTCLPRGCFGHPTRPLRRPALPAA